MTLLATLQGDSTRVSAGTEGRKHPLTENSPMIGTLLLEARVWISALGNGGARLSRVVWVAD